MSDRHRTQAKYRGVRLLIAAPGTPAWQVLLLFRIGDEMGKVTLLCGLWKNISRKEHPHRDLSTALRFGRDDKGQGGASRGGWLLNRNRFVENLSKMQWLQRISPLQF